MKCFFAVLLLLMVSSCSHTISVSVPSANATVSPPPTVSLPATNGTMSAPLANVTVSAPPVANMTPPSTNVTSPPVASPLPSTPQPTLVLPNEVAVHILERFLPVDSETHVGPIENVVIGDRFRLMTTFKAYEFKPAHVATMNCFFVNSTFHWVPMATSVENAKHHTGEPAFCTRRDLPDDETTFAVAQFARYVTSIFRRPVMRTRTFAAAVSSAKLVEHARTRGWTELPLVWFRVTKLQHWQAAPVLTFVKEMYAVTVDHKDQAREHCLPDPTGLVERKIEGGDYYAGVEREKPLLLCVSYIQRGLQDVAPREEYLTSVHFRDSVFWRKSCATAIFDMTPTSIYFKGTDKAVVFTPSKGGKQYLCFTEAPLTGDYEEATNTRNPSAFAKRVFFDEQFENRDERLRVEYHDKTAWYFPAQLLDMDAVKKF